MCTNLLIPPLAAVMLAVLGMLSSSPALSADTCASQAGHALTNGGRWYYRLDRVNHRKCWYVKKLEIDPDPAIWLDVALSPKPREQPTLFSWFSSLAAGLWRPTFTETQPKETTNESRLIQTTANARLTIDDIIPKSVGGHGSRRSAVRR